MDAIDPTLRGGGPPSTVSPSINQSSADNYQQRTVGLLSAYPEPPSSLNDQQPHHGSYGTPQSVHGGDTPSEAGHADNPDYKRPRACEACRGLKVKCEPDVNNPDGPCKRCTKANRNCVVTVPSRKRQKKTDGRVAELEKKIDALTATLQASKSGSVGHDDRHMAEAPYHNDRPINPYDQVSYGSEFSARAMAEQAERRSDLFPKPDKRGTTLPSPTMVAPPMVVARQKRKFPEYAAPSPSATASPLGYGSRRDIPTPQGSEISPSNDYADVIDRGIISAEVATLMFDRYVNAMAPHIPAVVFQPGTTAAEIRKSKPILFLAILSTSSYANQPELQRVLTKEVMQIFADRIICHGEKSLELIQALLITSLWYWPPEHFEELKFYQLIHIAAVMAIDIGLGKKQKHKRTRIAAGIWRDNPWRRTPFPDSETVEARRTWLACYFMCCTASMGFRRPNLIRWTPFMSECIDFLYTSPDALPSDKFLCEWVKGQHIAENIGISFSMDDTSFSTMDDPAATIQISDPKVQFALKGFERDLNHWASHIPPEVRSPTLKICEHTINLYMHEVALHAYHNVDEFRPPFTEEKLSANEREPDLLTASHISALSVCLTSIDGIFETFLSLEVDVVRSQPVFHFVRAAYAVIVLIKMYFTAASSDSELGKVIDKDNMKVEQYLDGLLEKFRAAAEDDRCRPASKFLMVLVMLKTWFQRQKEGKSNPMFGLSRDSARPETSVSPTRDNGEPVAQPNQPPSQVQGEYAPNTPLQLLSEVATNSGPEKQNQTAYGINNSNNMQAAENSEGWQAQQPYQYSRQAFTGVNPNIDPSMNPQPSNPMTAGPTAPQANMRGTGTTAPWNGGYADFNQGNGLPAGLGGMDLEYSMGDGFEQAMGMTLGYGDFMGKYFEDDQFFGGYVDQLGGVGMGFGHGG